MSREIVGQRKKETKMWQKIFPRKILRWRQGTLWIVNHAGRPVETVVGSKILPKSGWDGRRATHEIFYAHTQSAQKKKMESMTTASKRRQNNTSTSRTQDPWLNPRYNW
jgi:hypothetical protein